MHQRVLEMFIPFDVIMLLVGICSQAVITNVNMFIIYKTKYKKSSRHSIRE